MNSSDESLSHGRRIVGVRRLIEHEIESAGYHGRVPVHARLQRRACPAGAITSAPSSGRRALLGQPEIPPRRLANQQFRVGGKEQALFLKPGGRRPHQFHVPRVGALPLFERRPRIRPAIGCRLRKGDEAAVLAVVMAMEAAHGPLDLAILNAGTYASLGVNDFNCTAARALMEVNYFGICHGLAALMPRFIARRRGIIAAMASLALAPRGAALGGHAAAWFRALAGLANRAIPICEWLAYRQGAGTGALHPAR